jgi:hypothetical protein
MKLSTTAQESVLVKSANKERFRETENLMDSMFLDENCSRRNVSSEFVSYQARIKCSNSVTKKVFWYQTNASKLFFYSISDFNELFKFANDVFFNYYNFSALLTKMKKI